MIKESHDAFSNDTRQMSYFSWIPTDLDKIVFAEKRLFDRIPGTKEEFFIRNEDEKYSLRTVIFRNYPENDKVKENKVPIFFIHGFAAGSAIWFKNAGPLSRERRVYSIDLLGFGRSTRKEFPTSPQEIEDYFVNSIEFAMKSLNIDRVILIGQSFGGYLAGAYALKHGERIEHLILVDPWGYPENVNKGNVSRKAKLFYSLPSPLTLLRYSGRLGPYFLKSIRQDFDQTFAPEDNLTDQFTKEPNLDPGYLADETDDTDVDSSKKGKMKRSHAAPKVESTESKSNWSRDFIYDYIYHINVRPATGEAAFYGLSEQSFYAAMPMVPRLKEVNPQIPITFIYGGRSWIDKASGLKVKGLRNKSYVDVKIIPSGGHHAFAQCASEFNAMVLEITKKIDANFDFEKSL